MNFSASILCSVISVGSACSLRVAFHSVITASMIASLTMKPGAFVQSLVSDALSVASSPVHRCIVPSNSVTALSAMRSQSSSLNRWIMGLPSAMFRNGCIASSIVGEFGFICLRSCFPRCRLTLRCRIFSLGVVSTYHGDLLSNIERGSLTPEVWRLGPQESSRVRFWHDIDGLVQLTIKGMRAENSKLVSRL